MRYFVVIPAAGSGRRFSASVPKQYAALGSSTVIEHALAPFEADPDCAGIVRRGRGGRFAVAVDRGAPFAAHRNRRRRRASARTRCAMRCVRWPSRVRADDWIMVHDAARPCFSAADLAIAQTRTGLASGRWVAGGAAGGHAQARAGAGRARRRMSKRPSIATGLARRDTAGVSLRRVAARARSGARCGQRLPTDEAQAIEWSGQRPRLVAGRADNIKVTTADDLALAAAILSVRATQEIK